MLIENILGIGSITGALAGVGYLGAAVIVATPVLPLTLGAVAFLWGAVTFLDELAKNR